MKKVCAMRMNAVSQTQRAAAQKRSAMGMQVKHVANGRLG
jgi:hypothetical protein